MKARLGYRSGSTILHRLHPLLKLAWLIFITAVIFLVADPIFNLSLVLVLLFLFPLVGVRFREVPGFKMVLAASAVIFLLQVLFWKEGSAAAVIGPIRITYPGISRGIYLGARFISVVLVSYLFVLTTSPNQLAYSLMRAGLPYRYGFTFVTALRMIPIFEEEVRTVYQAQQVRGVSYRPRKWNEFWQGLKAFTLPLLISAMGKVDTLSISMEGRCFGMHSDRTYLHDREEYSGDLWAGLALALGAVSVIFYRLWEVIF